jgi:selenocysteine lyase/cysteine desulfurase
VFHLFLDPMNSNRRRFLRQLSGTTAALTLAPFFASTAGDDLLRSLENFREYTPEELAGEEEFWRHIKQAYTVSPTILNLNNGGVCPQPKVVQEAVEHYNRLSNEAPSYYMWRILDKGREPLREKLADLAGCSIDEIAINRNASEALETIIFGLRLQAGDEVVLSKYDYPNMINAWKQRAHRDGIILKWVQPATPSEDPAALARPYIDQFTSNTRIVHLTHMINWSGQILPVNQIAKAAHQRGIEVLVDGAHTFTHIDYKIPDLDCDYFGTSLHKWLCAPFGSGMLYVRKEKIKNLYPLFAAPEVESDDIRKFEHLGTRSFAIEQAIAHAIEFHHLIGSERKQKRLHFLKNYWLEKVQHLPGIQVNTPLHPEFSGAIALIGREGHPPVQLSNFLFKKHGIHTVSIEWEDLSGVRITPNVYTSLKDLDRLVKAFEEYCQ